VLRERCSASPARRPLRDRGRRPEAAVAAARAEIRPVRRRFGVPRFRRVRRLEQGLISHHYYPGEGVQVSMPFRYVWPSELDLMARIAGMQLRERWSGWLREPFTAEGGKHVSVWAKL